jgi:hypothetical protein
METDLGSLFQIPISIFTQGLGRVGRARNAQPIKEPVKWRHPTRLLAVALVVLLVPGCDRQSTRAGAEATLPELNRALAVWTMAHGATPKDVSQLTNFPVLQDKSLPKPPPGKKLAIDQSSHQVVFIDE